MSVQSNKARLPGIDVYAIRDAGHRPQRENDEARIRLREAFLLSFLHKADPKE